MRGLAVAFQGAVALGRALSALTTAPNIALRFYPVPKDAVRQSRHVFYTILAKCVAAIYKRRTTTMIPFTVGMNTCFL